MNKQSFTHRIIKNGGVIKHGGRSFQDDRLINYTGSKVEIVVKDSGLMKVRLLSISFSNSIYINEKDLLTP